MNQDGMGTGARRLRRIAGLAVVPVVIAAAVSGAIAASPGPEAELAAGKGKVVKYEGTWLNEGDNPMNAVPFRASGFKAGREAVRVRGAFEDADRCPTKMSPADLRGGDKLRRRGKSTWRSRGKDDSIGQHLIEAKIGRKAQFLRVEGDRPACNTDGFYAIRGRFKGPKGGTALGKRFTGTLKGSEDPPNRINLELRAKRVG